MHEDLVVPVTFRLLIVPGGSSPLGMQVELMIPGDCRPLFVLGSSMPLGM